MPFRINMRLLSGIYLIRNKQNDHIYIGSSVNIHKRWIHHLHDLRHGIHHSRYFQNAWNKYGEHNFEIEILITCDKSMLKWYEQQFLDEWNPEYNKNTRAVGPELGHLVSDRVRSVAGKLITPYWVYEQNSINFAGDGNPSAKLSKSDVLEIVNRLKNGESKKNIALDFNVHPSTIWLISKGKKWSTVIPSDDIEAISKINFYTNLYHGQRGDS